MQATRATALANSINALSPIILTIAAAVCGNRRIEAFAPDVSQRSERSYIIGTYQPRVTGHVGTKNSCKAALSAFFGHLGLLRSLDAVQQIVCAHCRRVYWPGLPD